LRTHAKGHIPTVPWRPRCARCNTVHASASSMTWFPPRSPWGLIQEDLFPSEWFILVSCVMLNCTLRKQVERVLPNFIARFPTPETLIGCEEELTSLIAPLGFKNRRAQRLT